MMMTTRMGYVCCGSSESNFLKKCWVTTCGKYSGGGLHFAHLNITIMIEPEDIVAFRSAELEHKVLPYYEEDGSPGGERYSVVIFQGDMMFFCNDKEEAQKRHTLKERAAARKAAAEEAKKAKKINEFQQQLTDYEKKTCLKIICICK